MSDVKRLNFSRLGDQVVRQYPQCDRVRFFLRSTNTSPLSQAWDSLENDEVVGLDGERILGTCEKRLRSVLVVDSQKDSLLRGVAKNHFRSCLCVPVLDDSKQLVGTLYLTSLRADAFSNRDRFALEQLAREHASCFSTSHEVERPPVEPPVGNLHFLFSPYSLLLAGTLLTMLILFGLKTPDSQSATPNSQSTPGHGGPREAVLQYIHHLRIGEFAQAWNLMDGELQARWPLESYIADMGEWSDSERHQSILLQRELAGLKKQGEIATAVFYPSGVEKDEGKWEWAFRQSDSQWRLVSINGGPVTCPEPGGL